MKGYGRQEYSTADPIGRFLADRWLSILAMTILGCVLLLVTGHKVSACLIVSGCLAAEAMACALMTIEKREGSGRIVQLAAHLIRPLFYLALSAFVAGIVLIPAG